MEGRTSKLLHQESSQVARQTVLVYLKRKDLGLGERENMAGRQIGARK